MKNPDKFLERAEKALTETKSVIDSTSTKVSETKEIFPRKKEDLEGRFAALIKKRNDLEKSIAKVREEHKKDEKDLAVFGDGTIFIEENLENLKKDSGEIEKRIIQLSKSYTKILSDMKIGYSVEIGRSTWDESSDFATEYTYTYPARTISENAAAELAKYYPNREIARVYRSSPSILVSRKSWSELGIHLDYPWRSGSADSASFWVDDAGSRFYHKYIIVEDDKKSETDWIEVDESYFNANKENLGMAVVSKPYGSYEDEKLTQAAPPEWPMLEMKDTVNGAGTKEEIDSGSGMENITSFPTCSTEEDTITTIGIIGTPGTAPPVLITDLLPSLGAGELQAATPESVTAAVCGENEVDFVFSGRRFAVPEDPEEEEVPAAAENNV